MVRFTLLFAFIFTSLFAKLPELSKNDVTNEFQEIMKMHASVKEFSLPLVKSMLSNFIDQLDPAKTYFIESDINQWIEPNDALLNKVLEEIKQSDFSEFELIHDKMILVIVNPDRSSLSCAPMPKRRCCTLIINCCASSGVK